MVSQSPRSFVPFETSPQTPRSTTSLRSFEKPSNTVCFANAKRSSWPTNWWGQRDRAVQNGGHVPPGFGADSQRAGAAYHDTRRSPSQGSRSTAPNRSHDELIPCRRLGPQTRAGTPGPARRESTGDEDIDTTWRFEAGALRSALDNATLINLEDGLTFEIASGSRIDAETEDGGWRFSVRARHVPGDG